MPATYEPIATTTASGSSTTVIFSSIPTTYTDLVIVASYGTTTTGNVFIIQVGNGSADTGSNYSRTNLYGTGSVAGSGRTSNATYWISGTASGADTNAGSSNFIGHIMNYSNTTTNKTMLNRQNSTTGGAPATEAVVSLWRSTAAINYLKITADVNFTSGSIFTIYGIKAA